MAAHKTRAQAAAIDTAHPNLRPLDRDFLLICGAQRSGTRYMAQLAHDVFDYGLLAAEVRRGELSDEQLRDMRERPGSGEAKFLLSFYYEAARCASFEDGAVLAQFVRRLLGSMAFGLWRVVAGRHFPDRNVTFTVEEVVAALPERTYPAVAYTVLKLLAAKLGNSRVGCTFPAALQRLDVVNAMFPRAKVIHCVRDGRDVILSTFQTQFGARTVYHAAREWDHYIRSGMRWLGELFGPERYLEIKYEDRLLAPKAAIERIASFIGVPPSADALAAWLDAHEKNPRKANLNKWRQQMTSRQIAVFEAVAGRTLYELGYDSGGEPARIGALARAAYGVANFALKIGPAIRLIWRKPGLFLEPMFFRRFRHWTSSRDKTRGG